MLGDPASRSFRLLLLSTGILAYGLVPGSGRAAGPDQGAAVTLADMAGRAAIQAQKSLTPADRLQPLETVGAKGGVPQSLVSDGSEPVTLSESLPAPEITEPEITHPDTTESDMAELAVGDADRLEQIAAEGGSEDPEPFMERLSRIMAEMSAGLEGGIVRPETATSPQPDPAAQAALELAAQAAEVPDDLVARLHARSLAEGAGSAAPQLLAVEGVSDSPAAPAEPEPTLREFMPVVAAPKPVAGSEPTVAAAPDAEAAEKSAAVPSARDDTVQFRATGLTLADMAMEVTPAPSKQAVPPLAPAAVPLASLIVPHAGSAAPLRPTLRQTALTSPRFVLPAARLASQAKPRLALRFPDPRSLGSRLGPDPENKAWQYPASASLAQFLGGIERMPVPARGRGIMPVNLEQIARQAQGGHPSATRVRRPAPGFSFSFSGESFAGNRLTGQSAINPRSGVTGRRQAVMNELRRVFTPVR